MANSMCQRSKVLWEIRKKEEAMSAKGPSKWRMSIVENLKQIQRELEACCAACGREPSSVRLLPVSKTKPMELLKEAYGAGVRAFGENHVQELLAKSAELPGDIEWHMIGHLQTNKVKQLVGHTALIHSLDSLRLGEALSRQAERLGVTVNVLVEINAGRETSKSGFLPEEAEAALRALAQLPGLRIRGLMTVAPISEDESCQREIFRSVRLLAERLNGLELPGVELRELSMGMSGDFRAAIAEGATIVRIGSAIFGERDYTHR